MKPFKFLTETAKDVLSGGDVYYENPKKLLDDKAVETVKPTEELSAPKDTRYSFTEDDLEEAKHVLYGEISDRDIDKQTMEAEVILNTAINRVGQYAEKGKEMSLADVLRMPNQYQAYMPDEPDSLYNQSKRGEYATGGERRIQAIEDTFAKAQAGDLEDNTNGSVFYIHNPDGTIEYDDTRKLYK